MRILLLVIFFGLIGCSAATVSSSAPVPEEPKPDAESRLKPLQPGSDWPTFLGPNGDGSSPEKGINTNWKAKPLKKLWECNLGIGYAPPVVVQGKLYHFDRLDDFATLCSRNAETGELLWQSRYPMEYEDRYGYDPGPRACPVVDGDRVYTYGVEGVLQCVSIKDRKQLWTVDTKKTYRFKQNFFGVGSVPLVNGDKVIVAVGGSDKGMTPADHLQAKSNGTAIVAFDKLTGQEKYKFGDDLSSYASPMLATFNGQKVGLYFARGGLLGFDPDAGKQLFHFKWRARLEESVNAANPVVFGDKVFISECYQKGSALLKIANNQPTAIWTDDRKDGHEKAMLAHWCTPVYEGGFLYGCSGRNANDSDLRCVNVSTEEVVWRVPRTTRCTLLKVDGHILSLGEAGELRLFKINPEKYEELSRWDVPELSYPSWAPPVLSRGLLYLRGKDDSRRDGHKLVCYDFRQ